MPDNEKPSSRGARGGSHFWSDWREGAVGIDLSGRILKWDVVTELNNFLSAQSRRVRKETDISLSAETTEREKIASREETTACVSMFRIVLFSFAGLSTAKEIVISFALFAS
jgi:hypothetical protein